MLKFHQAEIISTTALNNSNSSISCIERTATENGYIQDIELDLYDDNLVSQIY